MISLENLNEENLDAVSRSLQLNDTAVLERMFHAFILLDRLTETGLDFIFKGGTSVLLHTPDPKRLSVDIDIVCSEEVKIFDIWIFEAILAGFRVRHICIRALMI